jgi:PAS domain S-box-containing protein
MGQKHYLRTEFYELIRSDESIFDFVQEAAPHGLYYRDLENPENEWINPSFWLTLGYDPTEMPHTPSTRLQKVHPEDLNIALESLKLALTGSSSNDKYQIRYIDKENHTIWLSAQQLLIQNAQGTPTRLLVGFINTRPVLNEKEEMTGVVTSFKDIIASSRVAEKKLQFQAKLLSAVGQAIIATDPNGKIIYWNEAAEKIYGWNAQEVIGNHILEIDPGDLTAKEYERIIQKLSKGETWSGEFMTIKKNGEKFSAYFTNSPVFDEAGELSAVIRVTTDISERIKTKKALQESEESFKAFTNNIPGLVYIKYPAGKHIFGNNRMLDYFGIDQETYQHSTCRDILKDYDIEMIEKSEQMDLEIIKSKVNLDREIFDEFSQRWFHEFKFLISEELIGGIIMDITDRKKGDLHLMDSEERLANMLNNLPGIVLRYKLNTDGTDELLFFSQGPSLEKLWNISWDQVTNKLERLWSLIVEEDLPLVQNSILVSMQELSFWNHEWRINTPDDRIKWLNGRGVPSKQKDGSVVWDTLLLDITNQKEAEEVKKVAHELEIKNKEMEQFAYAASHDLQEPLRTINSFAGLLSKRYKGKLDERADEYLHFISDATNRMSHFISSLLNYSYLGKNRVKSLVDCHQLVSSIQKDMASTIQKTNAIIITKNLPKLTGYELELRQLFQNLISNALKFQEKGTRPEITISAKLERGYWIFSIQDNGIGIAKEFHEKIFKIFHRLHSMSGYSGSGIGLANCEKIVELHLGKIWLESEPGQGSTFFFSIKNE